MWNHVPWVFHMIFHIFLYPGGYPFPTSLPLPFLHLPPILHLFGSQMRKKTHLKQQRWWWTHLVGGIPTPLEKYEFVNGVGMTSLFYYGRIKNCSKPPTSHFFGGDWSNSMTGIEVELMKCLVMLHDFTYFWNNNHGYFTQWLVGVNPMFTSYFEHILLMTIWS